MHTITNVHIIQASCV